MKTNIFKEMRYDLWVIAMDVVAVNLSYILALLIRYFVHNDFINAAYAYLEVCLKFAPIYTVICIVVFALFHLYGGMWRYAGMNDMNRIVGASAVTAVAHVLGTIVLFRRMPISYYVLGAGIQFVFVSLTRFSYRFITVETQRIRNRSLPTRNVMIVGSDISAPKVIKYLENESAFKPVVVVDGKWCGKGAKTIHGLPVLENAQEAMKRYDIQCVIIADPLVSDRSREEFRRICEERGIELHDYTGFLKNESGFLPLTDLTRIIEGEVRIRIGDKAYSSLESAMADMTGRYKVISITGHDIVIEVQPESISAPDTGWAKGKEEVSFF